MMGYQKICRLVQWKQYLLSYAYKFCREYKTTNVLLFVKFKQISFIIKDLIMEYKLHGMVTRRSGH